MEQWCVEAWDGQCFSQHSFVTDTQDHGGPTIPHPCHMIQMCLPLCWESVNDMGTKYIFHLTYKKRGFILEPNMNSSDLGTWIQSNPTILV